MLIGYPTLGPAIISKADRKDVRENRSDLRFGTSRKLSIEDSLAYDEDFWSVKLSSNSTDADTDTSKSCDDLHLMLTSVAGEVTVPDIEEDSVSK